MLPSVSTFSNTLLALSPVDVSLAGATQFIGAVASFINQVQAGPTGSPGILTYGESAAIAAMQSLPPVNDNSWITGFASAIHVGTTTGILVPGTVTSPAWTASLVDVDPPVIITSAIALSTLISGLSSVTSSNNPPVPMAQAISNYALALTFQCTGLALAPPGPPIPVPLTFNAE
jgi:hypothetical protein